MAFGPNDTTVPMYNLETHETENLKQTGWKGKARWKEESQKNGRAVMKKKLKRAHVKVLPFSSTKKEGKGETHFTHLKWWKESIQA